MPRLTTLRRRLTSAAIMLITCAMFSLSLFAQPDAIAPPVNNDHILRLKESKAKLNIIEKFTHIVELPSRILTVYGFDAEVIHVDEVQKNPQQIRVHALAPGVTTMVLVDEHKQVYTLEIFVQGDVRHLQAHINRLFPDANVEAIEVKNDETVILRGWVTQPEHITKLNDVAKQFYGEVLDQMNVGGVQQVQLRVKVMEVQRTKLRKMGFNFLSMNKKSYLGSTPGQLTPIAGITLPFGGPPSVELDASQFAGSQLSFGIVGNSNIFQGFLEALKEEGLLRIHAQPILVTTSGRPATVSSGGEFPVLVPQGLGTVSIEWRQFGVSLEAVPIILGGGRLRLELSPEVSERDFANAVTVNGLTVPGLTTRRVNTQVEMRFGETLMIAGLIARRQTASTQKTPVLGELPVVGAAFSRKQFDEVETELVVMVTPQYVAPMKPHQVPQHGPGTRTGSPTDRELYLDGMIEIPKYGDDCVNCRSQGLIGTANNSSPIMTSSPTINSQGIITQPGTGTSPGMVLPSPSNPALSAPPKGASPTPSYPGNPAPSYPVESHPFDQQIPSQKTAPLGDPSASSNTNQMDFAPISVKVKKPTTAPKTTTSQKVPTYRLQSPGFRKASISQQSTTSETSQPGLIGP